MIYSIAAILEAILISPRLPVIQSVRLSFFYLPRGVLPGSKVKWGTSDCTQDPPPQPQDYWAIFKTLSFVWHTAFYIYSSVTRL